MKTIYLLLFIIFAPLTFHAQRTLTGLWTGSRSNDSTTVRKDQSFEIALTQYKQKVYGYSRSSFIVNDTLFYIVKRVKGTIDGNVCEVHDDEVISTNFSGRQDKGVKVTTTFRMSQEDTTWHLDGEWKTNKTKNFYAISGKVTLKSESNLDNSKIFPHLEELKMADDVAFYKEAKAPVVQKEVKPEPIATGPTKAEKAAQKKQQEELALQEKRAKAATRDSLNAIAQNNKQEAARLKLEKQKEEAERKQADIAKAKEETEKQKADIAAAKKEETEKKQADIAKAKEERAKQEEQRKVEEQSKAEAIALAKQQEKLTAKSTEKKSSDVKAEASIAKAEVPALPVAVTPSKAAADVAIRKTLPPQTITFKSDSLELAIYDNGEIDGDTVSVLLNGEVILAKQGLKMSAIKKTIYIPANTDEITLLLYAENLGKYPPNTGLLTVHDGEEVYQVRFSADLQQNASVIFRRKKNP